MTRRRVIFPDPEIWTQPKENTVTDTRGARGYRRAAALIKHRIAGDMEGVNAVLDEVADDHQLAPLLGGILGTLTALANLLTTSDGKEAIAELIEDISNHDATPEPVRRAARYLIAFNDHNSAGMDAIIGETDDVAPTIISVLDIYARLVPTMCSSIGLDILDNGICGFAGIEVEGDQ